MEATVQTALSDVCSGADGWETVERDNGVVAAGGASDFDTSWDEGPEALMGGVAEQSSSSAPARRGGGLRRGRDRHGWRL